MAAKTFDEWWNKCDGIPCHGKPLAQSAWDAAIKSLEGVRERAPNRQSKPCHRCADYELILDVNYCPFCGFEFIRG
jgi:hypothetical protein